MEHPPDQLGVWDDVTQYAVIGTEHADSEGAEAPATALPVAGRSRRRSTVSGVKRSAADMMDDQDEESDINDGGAGSSDDAEASLGAGRRSRDGSSKARTSRRRVTPSARPTPPTEGFGGVELMPSSNIMLSSPARAPRNKWGLRGVRYDGNKKSRPWEVKISMYGKDKSLGYYETKEEAAIQYDLHTIQHRGAAVVHKLNYPDHPRVRSELEKCVYGGPHPRTSAPHEPAQHEQEFEHNDALPEGSELSLSATLPELDTTEGGIGMGAEGHASKRARVDGSDVLTYSSPHQ